MNVWFSKYVFNGFDKLFNDLSKSVTFAFQEAPRDSNSPTRIARAANTLQEPTKSLPASPIDFTTFQNP